MKVIGLLTVKNPGTAVRILTKAESISAAVQTAASDFNKQYGGLQILTSDAFHDGFIILDDSKFCHFGRVIQGSWEQGIHVLSD